MDGFCGIRLVGLDGCGEVGGKIWEMNGSVWSSFIWRLV